MLFIFKMYYVIFKLKTYLHLKLQITVYEHYVSFTSSTILKDYSLKKTVCVLNNV